MSDSALEALIKAVTTVFVLSLAVERMASLFKGRDIQPLRPRRASLAHGMRVNLARGSVVQLTDSTVIPIGDGNLRRDQIRAVITENTIFLGMLLALLTGANAFEGLPGLGRIPGFVAKGPVTGFLLSLPGILLTGAAAAIGSSFWYDLLGLLVEARRTKQAVETSTTAIAAPGADLTALKDQSLLFRNRRAAAEAQVGAWRTAGTIKDGHVVDVLEDPYIEIVVAAAAGKTPPESASLTVDGATISVRVRVQK